MGIREKDLQKIITKRIYSILVLPGIMAIINGVVFFGMDVFQNAENKVTKTLCIKHMCCKESSNMWQRVTDGFVSERVIS